LIGFAQNDTTSTKPSEKSDTIRIGGMIIIKKPGGGREIIHNKNKSREITIPRRKYNKTANISTNWWILDLGFSNFNDKTNYSSVDAQNFAPGSNSDWFKLKTWKSRNVNIWFFMQKLNIAKHALNLKYGLGLELNNYFFENEQVRFQKNPTKIVLDPSLANAKKNKLAADYLTVPVMLNINFTPGREKGFGISGGISAGYLYSSRQKTKIGGTKNKLRNDFDLEKWKISYVGELILGPVKLYGSYAVKNMWSKGLDQTPYTIGIRFSNW
jgi:hypothetical protein